MLLTKRSLDGWFFRNRMSSLDLGKESALVKYSVNVVLYNVTATAGYQ